MMLNQLTKISPHLAQNIFISKNRNPISILPPNLFSLKVPLQLLQLLPRIVLLLQNDNNGQQELDCMINMYLCTTLVSLSGRKSDCALVKTLVKHLGPCFIYELPHLIDKIENENKTQP
jgi:hypothetical protein